MNERNLPLPPEVAAQVAAVEEYRNKIARAANLSDDERTAAVIGATMSLLRNLVPDLVQSGRLDEIFDIAEQFYDSRPPDPLGGNDTRLSREFLNVSAAVLALYLHARLGLHITKARQRVSQWCGNTPSKDALRNWTPDYKLRLPAGDPTDMVFAPADRTNSQMTEDSGRVRLFCDSYNKIRDYVSKMPAAQMEIYGRRRMVALARRLQKAEQRARKRAAK